ncbi:uncharacterized protein EI97DRAFT_32889 [Westerdykella ornata]|uniref:Uncharacterized protein n=1 Tax=Westerdykella ornata TaxID=318751 RepID=A0A6A6K0I4_WESOR|nr:uncharacterized protein EI97DRAFT_32889 [Westerdykella ornata]KAF2281556.1 hypothetical protein EI97DRAFT_32889 [Westerdykella ornata]
MSRVDNIKAETLTRRASASAVARRRQAAQREQPLDRLDCTPLQSTILSLTACSSVECGVTASARARVWEAGPQLTPTPAIHIASSHYSEFDSFFFSSLPASSGWTTSKPQAAERESSSGSRHRLVFAVSHTLSACACVWTESCVCRVCPCQYRVCVSPSCRFCWLLRQ